MADILRDNFISAIPELIGKIQKCDFIAIDTEFTGFNLFGDDKPSLFDFPPARYEKLKNWANDVHVIQYGLALFKNMPETNEYKVEAFNVYTYPIEFSKYNYIKKVEINFTQDSLDFLTKYHFDFEKYFKNGIPYLNKKDEEIIQEFISKYPDFMNNCTPDEMKYFADMPDYCTRGEIIDRLKGFTRIIEAITTSNKPVVGHNMLLDLILTYTHFVNPLPENYEDFKEAIHSVFPNIYDTKNVSIRIHRFLNHKSMKKQEKECDLLKGTSLYDLHRHTAEVKDKFSPKFIMIDKSKMYDAGVKAGETRKEDEECAEMNLHEAGFDAILTGIVFIRLAHLSMQISPEFLKRPKHPNLPEVLEELHFNQNQLYLARAPIQVICLTGRDCNPSRPYWLAVTSETSKKARTQFDIKKLTEDLKEIGITEASYDWKYDDKEKTRVLVAIGNQYNFKKASQQMVKKGYTTARRHFPGRERKVDIPVESPAPYGNVHRNKNRQI